MWHPPLQPTDELGMVKPDDCGKLYNLVKLYLYVFSCYHFEKATERTAFFFLWRSENVSRLYFSRYLYVGLDAAGADL